MAWCFFPSWRGAFGLLLVVAVMLPGVSQAEPSAAESGTIINLSGRQRMLSQKLTKELLLVALDLNKDTNLQNAAATAGLFDSTLRGLRNGDPALGLPPTVAPQILQQLAAVDSAWTAYKAVADAIVAAGAITPEQVTRIAELNLPLLDQMNRCVKLYEEQASSGSMAENHALAVAVNLSGRQRMLSQRMTKEYLLLALDYQPEATRLKLGETTELFSRTLAGLRDGDAMLGLSSEINTPQILAQLDVVVRCWQTFEPHIRAAIDDREHAFTPEAQRKVAVESVRVLAEMNKVVSLYEALTK